MLRKVGTITLDVLYDDETDTWDVDTKSRVGEARARRFTSEQMANFHTIKVHLEKWASAYFLFLREPNTPVGAEPKKVA